MMYYSSCRYISSLIMYAICVEGTVSLAHLRKSIISVHRTETLANMGKEFGNLAKISGVVYFRLSPYEQKAFKGMVTDGVPNLIRRFQSRVFRVVPPFIANYLLMSWALEYNHKATRKNPKDFENDT